MTTRTRERAVRWGAVALVALAAAGGAWAGAEKARPRTDPRLFDLKKKVHGRTGAEWTAEWWQWAMSVPAAIHPMLDSTGDSVEIGQRGPVWFLGGIFNESGTATRRATIPAGRALLVPILNQAWDNVGYDPPYTVDELRGLLRDVVATYRLDTFHVYLDGNEIPGADRWRIESGPFTVALPPGSLVETLSGGVYQPGLLAPVLADGYWVMLRPLPVGDHTLRFTGSMPGTTLDITYEFKVVEYDQPFPAPGGDQ
jgi:hypothetical protein